MEAVNLAFSDCQALIDRITKSNLSSEDQYLLKRIVSAYVGLESALKEKNISIKRLQEMVFGQSRNKKYGMKSSSGDRNSTSNQSPSNTGRNKADDYTGAVHKSISHPSLKSGDDCPLACGGKVYTFKPSKKIKISGGAIAQAVMYHFERLRCNLCGALFTADLPKDVSTEKYDASFIANLAIQRFLLGTPLYRIERLQSYLGVPLPDSTAWEILEQLAYDVYPIYNLLLVLAANTNKLAIDDTRVRILSVMAANKGKPKNERRGTYTNGTIAYTKGRKIVLYQAGTLSAGKRLKQLLTKKISEHKFILMSDAASSNNIADINSAIKANCLAHGRRKFSEILEVFPQECQFVVDVIAFVYHIDHHCRINKLSDKQRLEYHQQHSGPVMGLLHQWLTILLKGQLIAENDSLGQASVYMLKHWDKLTRFLEVPGCPLDNNYLECMLKIPIRQRKNSLFFKTEHSAQVGSVITSLLTTAMVNDINPIAYIQALVENKNLIIKEPQNWLPWAWQSKQSTIEQRAA